MEIILITMAVVGGTMGILDTIQEAEQAEFNEEMARRNAAQQQANAQQQRNLAKIQVEAQNAETNAEVDAVRRKNQAILAQNRAEAGMLGIDTTGSSLLLAVDNAENAELEALEVKRTGRNKANQLQYEGDVQAYNYELAAQNYLMEADYLKRQKGWAWNNGAFNVLEGAVSGATSAISGVNAYNQFAKANKMSQIKSLSGK
jgi:hypothetical protein